MRTDAPPLLRPSQQRLTDFAGHWSTGDEHWEASPDGILDVVRVVREAVARGMTIRVRGQGHSLNGSSLPRAGEMLLRTHRLSHVRLEPQGRLLAGSGAVVWHLEEWLQAHGRRLPLLHDGGPGPSLGGWVAAGGVSSGSAAQGGLWNAVEELIVVRPTGQLLRVGRTDDLFPWMFGAMGQLGIVAGVVLQTLPLDGERPAAAPREVRLDPRPSDAPVAAEARLQWFNVMVDPSRREFASRLLDELEHRHRETYHYQERFAYEVAEGELRAPLLWPHAGSFWVVGTWGRARDEDDDAVERFDADFAELVAEHGLLRYVQAELGSGEEVFRAALGPVLEDFRELKQRLDPGHHLNRGSVFHAPIGVIGRLRAASGPTSHRCWIPT